MRIKAYCLILFLAIVNQIFASSQPVLQYSSAEKGVEIQDYLYILEDKTEHYTIESVSNTDIARFTRIDDAKDTLKRNTYYWLTFDIENTDLSEETVYLTLGLTQIVDFYDLDSAGNYVLKKYGYDVPDAEKEYSEAITQVIGFMLKTGEKKRLFFRVKSELNLKPDPFFRLTNQRDFHNEIEQVNILQGSFHGLIWMLVIYVFFLFLILKERIYLYYVFYAISFSLAVFILLGYARHYVLYGEGCNVLISEFIFQIGGVFYFLLSMETLDLKRYNYKIYKILIYLIGFFVFGIIVSAFLLKYHFYYFNLFSQIFLFVELIVFVTFLIILFKVKSPVRTFVMIGNFSLFIGAIIIIVELLFMKKPFLESFPIFQAGLTMEFLFFTIGLSKRFQYTEKEKRQAQQQLIEELQGREAFQQKINDELEEKVRERTQEINQSKEEIEQQREYIQQRNELLERSNKQLTENLQYASFVQGALLQDFKKIRAFFDDAFLLYQPHSYVSGDFYMFFNIDEKYQLLIVADCTGHGVPGAMITLLAQEYLSEIVYERKQINPAKILLDLEKRIVSRLINISSNENLHEGLDIGVMLINRETKKIEFAGAKMPLVYIKNKELVRIRGEKYGIGGISYKNDSKSFTVHSMSYEEGDLFYLYSDGFQDQLQEKTNKKFLSRNFTNILLENAHKTMKQQRISLLHVFNEWKGNSEQTDDVLVLGVKF